MEALGSPSITRAPMGKLVEETHYCVKVFQIIMLKERTVYVLSKIYIKVYLMHKTNHA